VPEAAEDIGSRSYRREHCGMGSKVSCELPTRTIEVIGKYPKEHRRNRPQYYRSKPGCSMARSKEAFSMQLDISERDYLLCHFWQLSR
jgi:hypothetical protein